VLKPAEKVKILLAMGFVEVRPRGSHKQFRDALDRCTTLPFHQSRVISPPLLRQIAKDVGMTAEDFINKR
jgi:predicted RNA binding protein YcfA (HicA-like mRNA interferase family)